jgi:hypothetical protein
VYEFKPETYSGKQSWFAYATGVSRYYTQAMRDRSSPSSELGGSTFQAIVEKNCKTSSGELLFEGDVRKYRRCSRRYECVHD